MTSVSLSIMVGHSWHTLDMERRNYAIVTVRVGGFDRAHEYIGPTCEQPALQVHFVLAVNAKERAVIAECHTPKCQRPVARQSSATVARQ